VLQIKSMADSLDHLRSICSDRELKRMETERADLEQKVADLENELGNPRQEVRDAVRAERARCDAENKKKVAPLEQKVKALEAVNKILRAEKATAQRSASKAKNHWEIYREADFRSLEERVDLHHTKVDAPSQRIQL
jgi:chromosome segregation ATPase